MMLEELEQLILSRRANPEPTSYTSRLLTQKNYVERKVHEELYEVIEAAFAGDRQQLIYELSDLFYHLLVLLGKHGILLKEISQELRRRRK
jgi:phosphoribosyl-ATP pyrophosphohydrolase/phosphoribosyl-AMP cyclohydrolase